MSFGPSKLRKRAKTQTMGVSKTRDHIQIKITIPNPYNVFQCPKVGLNGLECSLHLQYQDREPKSDHGCIKDHWPYPNDNKDAKPQSGPSSILQSPKWGPKGCGCSLHLPNHDREIKIGIWEYQRPRLRFETPVQNSQCPLKPQMRT